MPAKGSALAAVPVDAKAASRRSKYASSGSLAAGAADAADRRSMSLDACRTGPCAAGAALHMPAGARPASKSLTRLMTICGSNGFTRTPSQPTARARPSSTGSNAPVSSTTGMCAVAGFPLTNAATS
jgi:hypothetical protein